MFPARPPAVEPPDPAGVFGESCAPPGLALLLALLAVYQLVGVGSATAKISALLLLALVSALLVPAPRRVAVALLILALAVSTWGAVVGTATGPLDARSDRDDAVELAAGALERGESPWQLTTPLGSRITTGPTSVLVALPFVATVGRVEILSALFWMTLYGALLSGDLRRRNDTFLVLGLLCLLGYLEVQTTQSWALEELYWGQLWLVAAWWLVRRGAPAWGGAALGLALLTRLNYFFSIFGFLCWAWSRSTKRELGRMAAGGAAGLALVAAPFVLTAGPASLGDFAKLARQVAVQPVPAGSLIAGLHALGASAVGRAALAILCCALTYFASRKRILRSLDHPYWHVTLAAFLAHTLAWHPVRSRDYVLMFVIPALLAIAESGGAQPATASPASRRSDKDSSEKPAEGLEGDSARL